MTPLLDEMNTDNLKVEIINLEYRNQNDYGEIYSMTNEYQVTRDKDTVHYIQEIDSGRYYLHISTPYKAIIGSSQARTNLQLGLYLFGVLLLFVLFNMVILRQANQLLMDSENSREVYKKYAYQDTLTNAYTRLSLDHWLVDQKKRKSQALFSIVMLDIDLFKFINDAYGHQVGDEVLIKLADTINSIIRKDDFLIRYGGDEFLIVLDNARESHAEEILKRIQLRLETENIYEFPIRISYGIVELNDIQSYEDAIILADQRMYAHKKSKKQAN
jgi:diguanylate cyclase (GGDEF)-like protein